MQVSGSWTKRAFGVIRWRFFLSSYVKVYIWSTQHTVYRSVSRNVDCCYALLCGSGQKDALGSHIRCLAFWKAVQQDIQAHTIPQGTTQEWSHAEVEQKGPLTR